MNFVCAIFACRTNYLSSMHNIPDVFTTYDLKMAVVTNIQYIFMLLIYVQKDVIFFTLQFESLC